MKERNDAPRDKSITLVGKLDEIPVIVTTDSGKQESILRGEIAFTAKPTKEGVQLWLTRLNLVGSAVECEKGSSGVLSVNLGRKSREVKLSPDGKYSISTELLVHYTLIDEIHGYMEPTEENQHYFVPYVDTSRCELGGRFELPIDELVKAADAAEGTEEEIRLGDLTLQAQIATTEYRYVEAIELAEVAFPVLLFLAWEDVIDIQPVFVRSGPRDTSPTGWSFDVLMQSARCIWRKCCVHFDVRDPMYVDNADYKVLNSAQEAYDLRDEVTVDDAVEVFFARDFDPMRWGGGATFSSGTASAKIVTCDEQLCVEDVNGDLLGAVNVNHLAHEIGHVLGLSHPGSPYPGLVEGTPNTVMEPSGFYADNPHAQSQHNCDSVSNPLIRSRFVLRRCRCVQNPEL